MAKPKDQVSRQDVLRELAWAIKPITDKATEMADAHAEGRSRAVALDVTVEEHRLLQVYDWLFRQNKDALPPTEVAEAGGHVMVKWSGITLRPCRTVR